MRLDLLQAHFQATTLFDSLDCIVREVRRSDMVVDVTGLNRASATTIEKYAMHDNEISATNVSLLTRR